MDPEKIPKYLAVLKAKSEEMHDANRELAQAYNVYFQLGMVAEFSNHELYRSLAERRFLSNTIKLNHHNPDRMRKSFAKEFLLIGEKAIRHLWTTDQSRTEEKWWEIVSRMLEGPMQSIRPEQYSEDIKKFCRAVLEVSDITKANSILSST